VKPRVVYVLVAFLILALVTKSPTTISQSTYKKGPVIPLASGHFLTLQYDSSISDQDVQTTNSILTKYIPKLLDLFWSPTDDLTITIHKSRTNCGPDNIACEIFTDVYIGTDYWNYPWVWVHEFTHVLQYTFFDAPGHAIRNEALLFYAEPTAIATETILEPPNLDWWPDRSFLTSDYSVTEAIYNYNNYQSGNAHARTSLWVSLYQADHDIFKEVNAQLSELSHQRKTIANATDLRTIISEAAQVKLLDGLPVDQWLAVEGLLGKSEIGNATVAHVVSAGYEALTSGQQQVWFYVQAGSVDKIQLLDISQTWVKLYDAVSRTFITESNEFARVADSPFLVYDRVVLYAGQQAPDVIRADLHLVSGGFKEDRHLLLPLYSNATDAGSDVILISTPDGWLRSVTGSAQVADQWYSIVNGVLRFKLARPSDVKLSVGPQSLIRNFVPSSKVMVLGINYTAVGIVPTTLAMTTTLQTNTNLEFQFSVSTWLVAGVVIVVAGVIIMLAMVRRGVPKN
jgi:hypothetical protein